MTFRSFAVLAFAMFSQSVSGVTINLMDTTFNDADWTSTVRQDTTAGGTFSAGQILLGGNPGSAYRSEHQYFVGGYSIQHIGSLSYNPSSQGAIQSLDIAYDYTQLPPSANAPITGGHRHGMALAQNGTVFFQNFAGPLSSVRAWQTISNTGLTAADFISDSITMPDFSTSGGQINFGFFTGNTGVGNVLHITASGTDNYRVTIRSAAPSEVPEPMIMGMLLVGLIGLGMLRRKRLQLAR